MEEKKTLVWLNQDLKKQVDELKEWCDTTYKKAVEFRRNRKVRFCAYTKIWFFKEV